MSGTGTVYRAIYIPGNDLGNVTAETQFKNLQGSLATCPLPSDGQFSNQRMALAIGGRVATASNVTFTVNIYFGMSTTLSANTLLFTSGPQTVNNKKSNWHFDLRMFWDADSKTFCGTGHGQVANGIAGPTALYNVPSADPNVHQRTDSAAVNYGFTITGQFSGSNAGNHAFTDIFNLELL